MDPDSDPETSGDEIFSDIESDEPGSSDQEIEDADNDQPAHPSKRRKIGRTAREALHGIGDGIDHPEDAEASLLALEVRELLEESALNEDDEVTLHSIAVHISAIVQALPEAQVDPAPIRGFLSDLDFPTSRKFTFKPPEEVEIVGSCAIDGAALPGPALDLALVMPTECFDDKDQLNHRYHAKRALYLAHIAASLGKKGAGVDDLGIAAIDWDLLRGDPRRPILVLRVKESTVTAPGTTIRLLPAAPVDLFPLQKLGPSRNNLRSVTKTAGAAAASPPAPADATVPELLPTPYYNCGILQDMLLLEHTRTMRTVGKKVPALGEASILLRVWAERQRLVEGVDGVDGFLLTALLAQLLESGKASPGMSAMHLFRTTLMALHNPKTFNGKAPLSMQRTSLRLENGKVAPAPPLSKAWKAAGDEVVFMDSTGWQNLASNISLAALKQAQACAKRTAALLSASAGPDAFDAVFLARHSLASLYDVWYKVSVPGEQSHSAGSTMYASDVTCWTQNDRKSAEISAKALGDRATLVRVIYRGAVPTKDVAKKLKKGGSAFVPGRYYALVGARLDPTVALRGVDIGPAADSGLAAAQFRSFWGDRSELRRFQDGRISEAVVWETSPSQRHVIVDDVVRYALQRHLPAGTQVAVSSGTADGALRRKHGSPDADVAAVRLCEAAVVRLGKRLRTLDGLTLKIVGTQPLAPVLRHAAPFPPQPHLLAGAAHADVLDPDSESIPRCLPAVEILCQLEGSGKWPDGPAAFAKMKAAVGVELAQTLQSGFGIEASASEDYLDILSNGFAFRLILHTERDVAMQQMALTAAGMPHTPPEEDVNLRLWHYGTIAAAAAANPAFGPSVRLAKRWIGSQWLSPHFREEAIELIVAVAFTGGDGVAAPPPGSRIAGFLRFLNLLGNHPWTAAPLLGDVATGDPGPGRREVAARAHAAQRAAELAPAMFITGPKDGQCVGWTREHPTKPMLHRAAVLARRAAEQLEAGLCGSTTGSTDAVLVDDAGDANVLQQVFSHDENEYEIIVRLRSDALPYRDEALQVVKGKKVSSAPPGWKEMSPQVSLEEAKRSRAVLKGIPRSVLATRGATAVRKELLVGFDPVPLYVSLLEERFGGVAVVCADYIGGSAVGLKMRGPAMQPGPLRPEGAHAAQPLRKGRDISGGLVVGPDLAAVAADALALGAGLVEKVQYKGTSALR